MRYIYPPPLPPNGFGETSSEFNLDIEIIEPIPSTPSEIIVPPPTSNIIDGEPIPPIIDGVSSGEIVSSELVPPPLTASELAGIIQDNIVPPVEVYPPLTASELAEIIATTEPPTTSTYTAFEKPFEEYNVVEFSAFIVMIIVICSAVLLGCNIFKGKGGY